MDQISNLIFGMLGYFDFYSRQVHTASLQFCGQNWCKTSLHAKFLGLGYSPHLVDFAYFENTITGECDYQCLHYKRYRSSEVDGR